jgi:hypothetical protein
MYSSQPIIADALALLAEDDARLTVPTDQVQRLKGLCFTVLGFVFYTFAFQSFQHRLALLASVNIRLTERTNQVWF